MVVATKLLVTRLTGKAALGPPFFFLGRRLHRHAVLSVRPRPRPDDEVPAHFPGLQEKAGDGQAVAGQLASLYCPLK